MFDIGWSELVVIAIVALVVIYQVHFAETLPIRTAVLSIGGAGAAAERRDLPAGRCVYTLTCVQYIYICIYMSYVTSV